MSPKAKRRATNVLIDDIPTTACDPRPPDPTWAARRRGSAAPPPPSPTRRFSPSKRKATTGPDQRCPSPPRCPSRPLRAASLRVTRRLGAGGEGPRRPPLQGPGERTADMTVAREASRASSSRPEPRSRHFHPSVGRGLTPATVAAFNRYVSVSGERTIGRDDLPVDRCRPCSATRGPGRSCGAAVWQSSGSKTREHRP